MRHRVATLAAIASLLLGACSFPASPPASPSASSAPTPTASAQVLAGLLRAAVDGSSIVADLERLQAITLAAGGTRFAGGPGEANAAAFVAEELAAAGLTVTRSSIALPVFRQTGPGALVIGASPPQSFEALADFKPLLFSPSGDVAAPIVSLDFDPAAAPGATTGRGCAARDWAGFPRGGIALVQPGSCLARDVVEHAQDAGAVGVVRSYPGWSAGHVLRPTLLDPSGLTIPVLATTHAVGVALSKAAATGQRVRLAVEAETTTVASASVLAETNVGDPARVVMLGAHLDSVLDGPGINDDGSGAMTILEIGRRLSGLVHAGFAPASRVRLAFWAGEELGMWGSFGWLGSQPPQSRAAINAYLNFDMLGSPNGVRQIYHWSSAGNRDAGALETLFSRALELEGLASELADIAGSDDLPFGQAGIPTSGLFSGHDTGKTARQAELFGGTVGAPLDPCYHLACDTVDNIDPVLLGQMARAAAWVTGSLAGGGQAGP